MERNRITEIKKPLIEILGTRRVLIEHHCGICAYSDHRISVRVNYGVIDIVGDRLKAVSMTKDVLVINGCVFQLTLKREGDKN